MRWYISCLCAAIASAALAACSSTSAPSGKPGEPVAGSNAGPVAVVADSVVAPVQRPKSPHHVMVSLAGGASMKRDQQAYVVSVQDKIAERWQPVPGKLKYTVGFEFSLNRLGLVGDDIHTVSSMGNSKMIDSCRDAILRADRFGPLPVQFKDAPQTFSCEFMYNPPAQAETTDLRK